MSNPTTECERRFREFVHATNQGRCDDMPGKGCRCFTLLIWVFTEWQAWQACWPIAQAAQREVDVGKCEAGYRPPPDAGAHSLEAYFRGCGRNQALHDLAAEIEKE